jgi:hypothetical protein
MSSMSFFLPISSTCRIKVFISNMVDQTALEHKVHYKETMGLGQLVIIDIINLLLSKAKLSDF